MARVVPLKRGTLPDDAVVELGERYHKEECPMDPERLDWHTTVPKTGNLEGVECAVIRCVDCGGERTTPVENIPTDDESEG